MYIRLEHDIMHPNTMLIAYHIKGFINICWKIGNIFGNGAVIFSEKENVIRGCQTHH